MSTSCQEPAPTFPGQYNLLVLSCSLANRVILRHLGILIRHPPKTHTAVMGHLIPPRGMLSGHNPPLHKPSLKPLASFLASLT